MRNKLHPIAASGALILTILACNLPGGQSNDLGGTITAQAETLQAPTSTPTFDGTAAASISLTSSVVEVSVTSNTNCRTGPNSAFDLVFTMNPGMTAQVVGKDTPDNYWIINNPTGGTCWLWGQYAVLDGDTNTLPEYPAPAAPPKPTQPTKTPKPSATPKPEAPKAPSDLAGAYDRTCEGGTRDGTPIWIEDVTLTWHDNASDETGYRMYKNGSPVPDLPADSTQYHIVLRYNQGTGGALYDNFAVAAFNAVGESSKIAVDVPKCP